MAENKTKSAGLSITMIVLVIFLGFGFLIGLAQTQGEKVTQTANAELENYIFNEEGVWVDYIGNETDLEIPETYSLSSPTEMQMSATSVYTLISHAEKIGVKEYTIQDLSGYETNENGGKTYVYNYTMTFTWRKTIEGNDYTATEVGAELFSNNNSITSVKLPETITKLGSRCFAGAQSLKSINIPESVTTIENAVFYLCPSLEELILPNGVNYIGIQAFQNCYNLKSINIPTSLTYLYHWLFANTSITEITIPESVYGMAEGVFMNNALLEKVDFSEGLQYIGTNAFKNCTALTEVNLPSTIKYIYSGAFIGCDRLGTIILNSKDVPALYSDALPENLERIYVLDDLYESYLSNSSWSAYADKIIKISEMN